MHDLCSILLRKILLSKPFTAHVVHHLERLTKDLVEE